MSKTIGVGNGTIIISDAYFIASRSIRSSEIRYYRQ